MKIKQLLLFILLSFTTQSYAAGLTGRLGLGMTSQIESGMKALSVKLQRNRSSALGGHFGMDSSSDGMYYALGLKGYRYIYEEPQLNFYSALGAGLFSYKNPATDDPEQGYQVEALLGTELSLQGLESVGFSFEFGVGFSKFDGETHLKTVGHNLLVSAVHFYL